MGARNDDISLKLAKAVRAGWFPDISDDEVDYLTREAKKLFGSDSSISRASAFAVVKDRIESNRCCGISFLGDSTGNETTEWIYVFSQYIASQYPNLTVKHRLWDDATQRYIPPTVIQLGPLGERKFRATAKSLIIDATLSPHLSGDIDVAVKVAMDNWVPGSTQTLVGKFSGAGSRSWRFYINSTGGLVFEWSNDGTALVTKTSTVVTGNTNGSPFWVRATFDIDNGAAGNDIKFYTSISGTTWTQLGTTVTTAGVASVFNASTIPFELGGRSINAELVAGDIYEVEIRNGIDGPIIAPVLPDFWEWRDDTSYTFSGSPVLSIVNGSHPGAGLSYLNDSTRLPKMLPNLGQSTIVLSDSHNESFRATERFRSEYEAWIDAVSTQRPMSTIVLCTQNHKKSPATGIQAHADRQQVIKSIASKRRLSVIDAYKAFNNNDNLVLSDGIHPTKGVESGSNLWASEALDLFNISTI